MNATDVTVLMLMMSLLSVLIIGVMLSIVAVRYLARQRALAGAGHGRAGELSASFKVQLPSFEALERWLVIRSRNPLAAQTALGLRDPQPCSWSEGLARLRDHTLFISPPIDGWLLVVGPGLPDPNDDVDDCYHFIAGLSRELGHVQFFSANRALNHHAWVRAESGRILRAYAWAGETLWNQGKVTLAERDLGMTCLAYGEAVDFASSLPALNTEKIFSLAARWSLDPAGLDERRLARGQGIAGELLHFRQG